MGNDAIFKCSIPSFVSDFVFVDTWVDSEANILGETSSKFGNDNDWIQSFSKLTKLLS